MFAGASSNQGCGGGGGGGGAVVVVVVVVVAIEGVVVVVGFVVAGVALSKIAAAQQHQCYTEAQKPGTQTLCRSKGG